MQPIRRQDPDPVRRAVFSQRWLDLTFLHWPVEPALVAPLLPAGTIPDEYDGSSWVGLIPFTMSGVRIFGTPPLPYLARFPETNIRLYAVDADGRRGVVFRSLEAARLLPVLAARIGYHLPYLWASMSVTAAGRSRSYATSRRWPGPRGAGGRIDVTIGPTLAPGGLEDFLTARWGLFSTWYGGKTVWAPVTHEPWPLHEVTVDRLESDLVSRAGLPAPTGAPHAMWSPGVTVRIGRPVTLSRAES